jgi:transcriptional regulator
MEASVYVPEHFRETRIDMLQAFLERHPLATLVAVTARGLTANHIPLRSQLSGAGSGVLRGHIARANSLWRELSAGAAVLAIFTGADSYVSPAWYPARREHGKVVPTWNYATVHVSGNIRFIEDTAWLRQFVTSLTDVHERGLADRWQVSDAPAEYIDAMLRAIVGFEITVTGVIAKFKGSQNRSAADRAGVAAALRAAGRGPDAIAELAPNAD